MKTLLVNFLAVLLLVVTGPAQAISINITPGSQNITAGALVPVNLGISGLGEHTAPSLGTFDVNIQFDPSLLAFEGATFDSLLGNPDSAAGETVTDIILNGGIVQLFELSLLTASELEILQPSSFSLATLNFRALSTGTSSLSMSINALGDAEGNDLLPFLVPEPASGVLLGTGLLALVFIRRKQAHQQGLFGIGG